MNHTDRFMHTLIYKYKEGEIVKYIYPYEMPDYAYTMPYGYQQIAKKQRRIYTDPDDPYEPQSALPEALKLIEQAVLGEAEDRAFYEFLMSEAQSSEDKMIIMGIRDNEISHFDMFRKIYTELTGKTLPPPAVSGFKQPASYCAGLRQALMGEQNAVTKYRRILFAMLKRRHINMLTEIITDELRHLGLYNYLYAKNGCAD